MSRTLHDELAEAAVTLGLPPLSTAQGDGLIAFAELLARWNQRIRLVGPGDVRTIVHDHVIDALGFARVVRDAARAWWDIGSGAGLPGLILATLLPTHRFHLVEPIGKKIAFIEHAAAMLSLTNVEVTTGRIETLPAGGFNAALSRATFAPDAWFHHASQLVGPGGLVLVALGRADAPTLRRRAILVDTYQLPYSHAQRTNLLVRVEPS